MFESKHNVNQDLILTFVMVALLILVGLHFTLVVSTLDNINKHIQINIPNLCWLFQRTQCIWRVKQRGRNTSSVRMG